MFELCKNEIYDIHEFFEEWLNGRIPRNRDELQRIDRALSDTFLMISPNGNVSDKDQLLSNLMKAHGSWKSGEIKIKNMRCRYRENDVCLVIYEEWQSNGENGSMKGRLSSALFKKEEDGGIRWLHLHEVWI